MRREQALFNLEIKKKSGSSINPDIHYSKVPSSEVKTFGVWLSELCINLHVMQVGDLRINLIPLRYPDIPIIEGYINFNEGSSIDPKIKK